MIFYYVRFTINNLNNCVVFNNYFDSSDFIDIMLNTYGNDFKCLSIDERLV